MKHINKFENFEYKKNSSKDGTYNKVFFLDDDWILKEPLKGEEVNSDVTEIRDILEKFDNHIKIMQQYPEFFPKVKRLDKYRALIEQTKHIFDEVGILLPKGYKNNVNLFLYYIINKSPQFDECRYSLSIGDKICKKWFKFFEKLRHSELCIDNYYHLDLHQGNFGINKKGEIKLLDF